MTDKCFVRLTDRKTDRERHRDSEKKLKDKKIGR
jgi:hypothetical protein